MLLHIDGSEHRWFHDDRWYGILISEAIGREFESLGSLISFSVMHLPAEAFPSVSNCSEVASTDYSNGGAGCTCRWISESLPDRLETSKSRKFCKIEPELRVGMV